jgi:hypothetical protein
MLRFHASFSYQAGSGKKSGRVIAKVKWHPGELYPRVVIVTNMARRAENVVACSNKVGTCDQWIKEEKGAIKWIQFVRRQRRLSSAACAACNLGNFLRTLATLEPIKIPWGRG